MLEKEIDKKVESSPLDGFIHTYIMKMKGEKKSIPQVEMKEGAISATGGFLAIIIISAVAVLLGFPMVLGPMGASCLLVFAAHEGPFSQPRQILGGHLISTLAALSIWDIFGRNHLTIGITLAVILLLMLGLKMVHPPAAASGMVAINTQAGWGFLLTIMIGALLIVVLSVLYNNLFKDRQYPRQWF
ncbi:HPP family protein [Alkalihalophilus lindianensis]|uniref:HPP family protein n=1 Tax=Alkalihalophilus lindianensis TaxID=1630542 RepID=A0ABU3X4Q1_9BACI|nr:HPP family protein [Alkalihalophilus lindianensis]MDV2682865.1 HPP family protein [Alkalihalophilus lindianensis]